MFRSLSVSFAVAAGVCLLNPTRAAAQYVGTFAWQLQPFCNRVVVAVTQSPGGYELRGYDDQCGGSQPRAPLTGNAVLNSDGSVQLALSLMTPTAVPIGVAATVNLASSSGPWHDSRGNSGTFAFGTATGGPPRPNETPVSVLAQAMIIVGPNTFATAFSRGVSGVTRPAIGLYCLALVLPAGLTGADVYAQATVEWESSFAGHNVMTHTQQSPAGCPGGGLAVRTLRDTGAATDQAGFSVTVFRR